MYVVRKLYVESSDKAELNREKPSLNHSIVCQKYFNTQRNKDRRQRDMAKFNTLANFSFDKAMKWPDWKWHFGKGSWVQVVVNKDKAETVLTQTQGTVL